MTRASIREYVTVQRGRSLGAPRREKHRILDEVVAVTGYHRKANSRLLCGRPRPGAGRGRPGRRRVYGGPLAKLCLARAGRQDTPQEAILDWCIEAVKAWFQERADAPVDWLLGRRSYADVPLARLLKAGKKVKVNRWNEPGWSEPLVRAIELYLTRVNLIAPESLDLAPDLEIPLGEVWAWGVKQERLALSYQQNVRWGW